MTTQRMHSNTLQIVALAGMVGASLALLFAPRSGRETRDRIKSTANNMKHRAENKVETAKHTIDDRKHAAIEMKQRAEQALAAGKRSAREKYDELRKDTISSGMDETMPSDLTTSKEEA